MEVGRLVGKEEGRDVGSDEGCAELGRVVGWPEGLVG